VIVAQQGFLEDADIKIRLMGILKLDSSEPVPQWWGPMISGASAAAWGEILSYLGGRRYTPAQILAWNRGPEYQMHIALYWLGLEGTVTREYDTADLPKLDRRKELETVFITDESGTPIFPSGHNPVGYSTGPAGRDGRPLRGDRAYDVNSRDGWRQF
jgi:hypothetical protein